jgi:hypothetical protein
MIELLLTKKTNVYNYFVSGSGVAQIGSLVRTDNESGYSLDLFENESIPITYEISDIKDASIKKSPFSKNFLIPGTKRNSIAMGYPYMISTDEPFKIYNGEIVNGNEWHLPVQEAQLYIDGILAFTGQLELTKAVIAQGEVNSFEVNFLATQINIFDELENKNMRELNLFSNFITKGEEVYDMFNALSSDDTFTVAGSTYSGFTLAYPDWGFQAAGATAAYDDGVQVYATTGKTKIFTNSATPPTDVNDIGLIVGYNFTFYAFVKYLLDNIFDGLDFNYDSAFFESEDFKKLILLCYDSSELPSNTAVKVFGSNPSATTYFDDQIPAGTPVAPQPVTNWISNMSGDGAVPAASPFNANEGLHNPFGVWDADSGILKFNRAGNYSIQIKAVVDIRFGWDMLYGGFGALCPGGTPQNNVYDWATYPLLAADSRIYFYNQGRNITYTRDISGLTMTSTSLATPNTYTKASGTHYQWESSHDLYTTPLTFTINAQAGDEWKLYMVTDSDDYCAAPVGVGCSSFPIGERKYEAALDVMMVDISPLYPNWNQTIPDITQKDFLVGLMKHFNIYSEVAPNSRIITMEPRDIFYNQGNVQNWTNKINIASVRQIERTDPPLAVLARMKATDNSEDIKIQDTTADKLEYGSYKVFLENGKDQEQTIQSDFGSMTPLSMNHLQITGSTSKLIQTQETYDGVTYTWNVPNPALFAIDDDGTKQITEQSDMFLGYRPNLVKPRSKYPIEQLQYPHYFCPGATGFTESLITATGSPRCDHLWSLSSIGGTGTDVNFRETRTSWLSGGDTPPVFNYIQTNYEQYYENFYLNLNDQKVLSAEVRLQPADIARFSFRNPVWITFPNGDGDYFIVNSIQYDPTTVGPSKVELITFNKEYYNFSYTSIGPAGPPGPDTDIPSDDPPDYAPPPDQDSPGGEYPIGGVPPST